MGYLGLVPSTFGWMATEDMSSIRPNAFFRDAYQQFFNVSAPINVETVYIATEGMIPAINGLKAEIAGIRSDLAAQQRMFDQKLEEILAAVQHGTIAEIEIDDVDDSQARVRILELFKDSGVSLFYDEISEKLRLPLRQTVEICNQLESEGLIGEPATTTK